MDILHLEYPLVLFGFEGSALTLPIFLLSPRIIMPFHCKSTMTKDHFLLISYGTKLPLCVDVPLNTYSFIANKKRGVLQLERPYLPMLKPNADANYEPGMATAATARL